MKEFKKLKQDQKKKKERKKKSQPVTAVPSYWHIALIIGSFHKRISYSSNQKLFGKKFFNKK